jgi:hypothetical protein
LPSIFGTLGLLQGHPEPVSNFLRSQTRITMSSMQHLTKVTAVAALVLALSSVGGTAMAATHGSTTGSQLAPQSASQELWAPAAAPAIWVPASATA